MNMSQRRKMSTIQNDDTELVKIGERREPVHIDGPVELLPPSEKLPGTKDRLLLVFQFSWLCLLVLPSALFSLFRKIVPTTGTSFKDKVVLVSGAGRGLGRGLALKFAKEGAKVAVVDVDTASACHTAQEIVEAGGTAKAYTTNVAQIEQIRKLREEVTEYLGDVDVLVNNAGVIYEGTIEGMQDKDIRGVVEINLTSHFWMIREFLPVMKQRNSGHIVAICSASALLGLAKGTVYSSSKSGVMGLMDALREELRSNPQNNIKITTVYPYFTNTSAHYVDHWDLRVPAVSINEVVEATFAAVRRGVVHLTVPGYLYFFINLLKLLPQNIVDMARDIFYAKIILSSDQKVKIPAQRIIDQLSKDTR